MEYGDAINAPNLDRAVALAREERRLHPDWPLEKIAADAVRQAYCACVTAGKGAAPGRILAGQVSSLLWHDIVTGPRGAPQLPKGEEKEE